MRAKILEIKHRIPVLREFVEQIKPKVSCKYYEHLCIKMTCIEELDYYIQWHWKSFFELLNELYDEIEKDRETFESLETITLL